LYEKPDAVKNLKLLRICQGIALQTQQLPETLFFSAISKNAEPKAECFQKIGGKPPKWMVTIMENPIF